MENNETISILSLFDIDLSTTNIAKYNTRCYPLNNLFILEIFNALAHAFKINYSVFAKEAHAFKINYSVFAKETLYVGCIEL